MKISTVLSNHFHAIRRSVKVLKHGFPSRKETLEFFGLFISCILIPRAGTVQFQNSIFQPHNGKTLLRVFLLF